VFGEVAKILIASQQRDIVIDARLCNERIRDLRFEAARSQLRTSLSGSLPISFGNSQQLEIEQSGREHLYRYGIAQDLREHNRRQPHVTARETVGQRIDIPSLLASQQR
jgi:hypothetical protein